MEDVYVVGCSLEADKEKLLESAKKSFESKSDFDKGRIAECLHKYKEKLSSENTEIFSEQYNMLITEKGYVIAVFESELSKDKKE